jgi:hypothetical protein
MVPFLVAELCANECTRDFDRQLRASYPLAEAEDVPSIVLDGLVRCVRVATEESARPGHFVGGDARAGARAAHHDGAIHVTAHDRFGRGFGVVGIVNGRR